MATMEQASYPKHHGTGHHGSRSVKEYERSSYAGSVDGASDHSDNAHPMTAKSQHEAKLVRGARATVVLVLFLSAATVATLSYILLSQNETDSFHEQFRSAARQVVLMANRNAVNVFTSFSTMAAVYPTAEELSNETLPFITLTGFDALSQGFRNVSKASVTMFNPLLRSEAELLKWNSYAMAHTQWIAEGRRNVDYGDTNISDAFFPILMSFDANMSIVPASGHGPFAPNWQISPVPANIQLVNLDAWSYKNSRDSIEHVVTTKQASLSAPEPAIRDFYDIAAQGPVSLLHQPVFDRIQDVPDKQVIGCLTGFLAWQYFFENTLPEGQRDVVVVIDSCSTNSTFQINGPVAEFLGHGDLHDPAYSHMEYTQYFVGSESEESSSEKQCKHIVHVFPTRALQDAFVTDTPKHYAIVIVSIFAFAAFVFFAYDFFVTSRQSRTEQQASHSNAIVQELFPGDVATQLFASGPPQSASSSNQLKLGAANGFTVARDTIAELHPEATVLFADISGFTAWSSIRDPHQVFTLLESIFQTFDAVAKKGGIFKVETIGDCYVAACGVPKANEQHAVVMCRFARNIMRKFRRVCRSLELLLGPDTGDLALRVGIHSGPVTAGVLRGDRARFQLFGDTVNTAARMESTGQRERVHVSEQTAQQLIQHDKADWIVQRDDVVEAKGKGRLVTYWLKLGTWQKSPASIADNSSVGDERASQGRVSNHGEANDWSVEMPVTLKSEAARRNEKLVHWNCEILLGILQQVVSRRAALEHSTGDGLVAVTPHTRLAQMAHSIGQDKGMVVNEVAEIINMPNYVCMNAVQDSVELSDAVVGELRAFVAQIASLYKDNPFHNFEHASHVTMSVNKLLGRIVAPQLDLGALGTDSDNARDQAAYLHDHTCGITSDPLTQFAVVLSGLIHDLDHPGVSNGQLIREDPVLATKYQEKSVAEQNSVDLAWSVLMAPQYDQLRRAIFSTETELRRFRNLLVNSIIATDIFDKDQGAIRKNRWNKAFFETNPDDDSHTVQSRKATIVIEHLIQASDVAHTMQHWHVYQKWNQRLFDEMMLAHRAGRSDTNPADGWYKGELWFFDNYVIPLTKKLKECGVFGVSSDEYLNYALHNRDEWKIKGQDVVEQYLLEFDERVAVATVAPTTPHAAVDTSTRVVL